MTLKLAGPKPSELERHVLRQYVSAGWLRYWPTDLLTILVLAAANATDSEGDAFVDEADRFDLDETVWWDPADAEDAGRLDDMRVHMDRCSAAAGLPPAITRRDLMALAEHFGLVCRDEAGRVLMVDPLPLVADTGQLSAEEMAAEDKMRWEGQFERLTYRIIDVFVEGSLDEWRAPLTEIAERVDAPVDDTRHALAMLGGDVDFTVDPDPETVAEETEVVVRVDWAAFDRNRVHLTGPD